MMHSRLALYKPVEQAEEASGRSDELYDVLQDASWQLGGAPSVIAVVAPTTLDGYRQGVGNDAQLFCQTAQVFSSHAISLKTTHTKTHTCNGRTGHSTPCCHQALQKRVAIVF